jgi:hypothetical protein
MILETELQVFDDDQMLLFIEVGMTRISLTRKSDS